MAETPDIESADYRRNFAAGLVHGIFFQASSALANVQTVLPSFVALLTPSALAVGSMAAVQGAGQVIPQLFTAYLIEDRPRRKPILLWVITLRWVSFGLLAFLTWRLGATRPGVVLGVFLVLFGMFSLAGGVGTVVYADVFAKAIPTRRRGRFIGWRQLLGYGLAIAAGYVVKAVLGNERIAFPSNYALIFAFSALALLVAFTGFAMIREPVYPVERRSNSLGHLLRRAWHLAGDNANFRWFLTTQALTMAVLSLGPFYVVFALGSGGVSRGQIGVFLAVQMAGAAVSNLLWGWMGDRFGNRAVIVGVVLFGGLTPLAALAAGSAPGLFVVVFALMGSTISGVRLGFNNMILEMASVSLRPTCVALQNTLLTPVMLLPLVVGAVADAWTYAALFWSGAALMLLGVFAALRIRDPRFDPEAVCVEKM
ncbi:major Facilitator Superfamily protein [bacterium BMS3Abin02]|nr:major Facilitator Superfamily protein [bacterium BMS3Abin02]